MNLSLKKSLAHLSASTIILIALLPLLVSAQTRINFLPPCASEPVKDSTGKVIGTGGYDCDFDDLVLLVKNLINTIIILSTLFATAAIILAGFQLLLSGGDEKARNRAKDIMSFIGLGYLWILAAWIIVYTITKVLLRDETYM